MAQYKEELEKLSFSEQEQEELTKRLLKMRSTDRAAGKKLSYRLVAIVAVISMLIGAVGAASLAGVSPEFRNLFGISDEKQAENLGALSVQQTFEDKNGSGAEITVKEVVADQERLYILMEFAAPEGIVLPEADLSENEKGYWIYGDDNAASLPDFFEDSACTRRAGAYGGYSCGSKALADSDPTDNRVTLLYTIATDSGFSEEAQYCQIPNISTLWTATGGESAIVLEGMDIAVTIPMRSATQSYSFAGRCSVNLGGETLAVVENLAISPISISMDLVIPNGAQYDEELGKQGEWPVYVLLRDGTRVEAQGFSSAAKRDSFQDNDGGTFFRADHAVLTLEHPIDVGEIEDIVFAGDNDPVGEQPEQVGKIVRFFFTQNNFYNNEYWNKVNEYWIATKG